MSHESMSCMRLIMTTANLSRGSRCSRLIQDSVVVEFCIGWHTNASFVSQFTELASGAQLDGSAHPCTLHAPSF